MIASSLNMLPEDSTHTLGDSESTPVKHLQLTLLHLLDGTHSRSLPVSMSTVKL